MKKLFLISVVVGALSFNVLSKESKGDILEPSAFEIPLEEVIIKRFAKKNRSLSANNNGVTVIDLMAFYQPIYAIKLGGQQATHERIAFMVEQANIALKNSNINVEVKLVNAQPVTGIDDSLPWRSVVDENGDTVVRGAASLFSSRVLNPYGPGEGYPEYNAYSAFGADLTVYFRDHRDEDGDMLGNASLGREISTIFDLKAVNLSTKLSDNTYAHEFGHNLYAGHESTANDGISYEDIDAHAYSCGGKNTTMWSLGNPDNLHLFFSDPEKLEGGEYCGESGVADNKRVISKNALLAAERRTAPSVLGGVRFTKGQYDFSEEEGVVSITITRTGDLTESASVQVAMVDNLAKEGQDFLTSFERVEFQAGESTASFDIELVNDALSEGVEKANIILRYPYRLNIEQDTAILSISDSSVGVVGNIQVETPSDVEEGQISNIVLNRVDGLDGELVVRIITSDGTATSLEDYNSFNEYVRFADGESQKIIPLATIDDEKQENKEWFFVNITSDMDISISGATQAVYILDNDQDSGLPQVGQFEITTESLTVNEDVGEIVVTINRLNGSDGDKTIRVYTDEGLLKEGVDFIGYDKNIVFSDGETQKKVTITILDNNNQQGGDTSFYVKIDGFGADVLVDSVKIKILDNDTITIPPVIEPEPETKSSGGSLSWFTVFVLVLIRWVRYK